MKVKRFSLEEGGFKGSKVTAGQTYMSQGLAATAVGAGVGAAMGKGRGALVGSGIGLITGLITAALTRSLFNRKPQENITTKKLFIQFNNFIEASKRVNRQTGTQIYNEEMFDIEGDPSRFDVSVKANEDSIVLYIRPLSKEEIRIVSEVLDDSCKYRKNNDYIAEQANNGGWLVTMKLVDYNDAAELLFELMNQVNFRINFLSK